MSKVLLLGIGVLAWTTSACSSIPSVRSRIVTGPVAAPHTGEVRVLMTKDPVPPEYTEVALIEVLDDIGQQHLIEVLKAEAARLGCDTLVNVSAKNPMAVGVAVRTPQH